MKGWDQKDAWGYKRYFKDGVLTEEELITLFEVVVELAVSIAPVPKDVAAVTKETP